MKCGPEKEEARRRLVPMKKGRRPKPTPQTKSPARDGAKFAKGEPKKAIIEAFAARRTSRDASDEMRY